MMAIVPIHVHEPSIVRVVLNNGFFGDLESVPVLEVAVRQFEDLLSTLASERRLSLLVDANRRPKIFKDNIVSSRHLFFILIQKWTLATTGKAVSKVQPMANSISKC